MKTKELKIVAVKVRLYGCRRIIKHKVNTADGSAVVTYRENIISIKQGEKVIAQYNQHAVMSIEYIRKMA